MNANVVCGGWVQRIMTGFDFFSAIISPFYQTFQDNNVFFDLLNGNV
jgi:hypothetical protein